MLYVIGVNHGFQIVGKYPYRAELSAPLTFCEITEDVSKYQRPFSDWLRVFSLEKDVGCIFEEWPLNDDAQSSASFFAKNHNIDYIQIDNLPQIPDQNLREENWVEKIVRHFSSAGNGLLIVGNNHCSNLREKLAHKNVATEVIFQRELELKLIPQGYNDIILNVTNGF